MSLLSRIIESNLPIQLRTKASAPAAAATAVGVQALAPAPSGDVQNLRRAYTASELVYAAIDAKTTAASGLRLEVVKKQQDQLVAVPDHPLTMAWMGWETQVDSAQLFSACVASWDIARRVYIEKVKSAAGITVALNPLDPSKVKKQRNGNGEITYRWQDGGRPVYFTSDDLLIREPLWHDEAPLKVALGSVEADQMQTAYVRAFFGNAGVPSGVLTSDQELSSEVADELRNRWASMFSIRAGGAGKVAVLGQGTKYARMGANLDELDSESLRRVLETRVLAPFGVPPIVVYAFAGLDAATYSNIKSAFRWWFDSKLTPAFEGWRQWLLRSLLSEYESKASIIAGTVSLRWDTTQIAALVEDQEAKESRAREAFKAGGLTRAEYRARLGEEVSEADKFYILPLAVQVVPETVTPDAVTPTPAKTGAGPTAIKAIKAASTQPGQQRFARQVQSYIRADYQAAAEYVRRQAE